ncbi:MAG: tetratricopeptide repeat protein [Bacillus sp. (in: firmicutes)]
MITIEKVLEKINNGELEEAYKHIHSIQNSGLEEDIFVLAEHLVQMGFLEQAVGLYEQLLATHPEEGELLLSLAEIYMELDREDEALELVKAVAKDDPVYPSALLLEADLYALNGLEEVAYKKLKEAKKVQPDEILIDFALGEQCYAQGSYAEAIDYFEAVLKEHEELAGVSITQRIAEAYSSLGRFEEALPYYERSLQKKTELHTLFQYGFTAYQAGNYKTAINQLTKVKELDHEYHSLYFYLASAYEHLEDIEMAFQTVKEGIQQDEYNKELYFKAGKLALKMHKPEQAVEYFRQAIAIDPGYLEAGITLAKYFVSEELFEECIDLIQSIIEFGENDPQFDWMLALSYNGVEQFKEARKHFQEAYEMYKQDEDFLRDYGYFLIEEGDFQTAAEIFNILVKLNPWNEEYISVVEKLEHNE